jgi:PEP-CTERM motif
MTKRRWKRLAGLAAIGCLLLAWTEIGCADATWSGAALDGQWSNPGNWVGSVMPGVGAGVTHLSDQTNGSLITLSSSTSATVDADVFGPEFGMDLNIDGGTFTQTSPGFVFAPVATDEAGRSVISVSNGASMTVVNLLLGDNWWFQAPFVTMNVSDPATTVHVSDWVWLGGHLNLYDGVMDITGGFNMAANAALYPGIAPTYTPSDTLLDIHKGMLIIRDDSRDWAAEVAGWETNGYLKAYGGAGTIHVDTTTLPGDVIVTAEIPEPASLCLLSLGALALLMFKRRK